MEGGSVLMSSSASTHVLSLFNSPNPKTYFTFISKTSSSVRFPYGNVAIKRLFSCAIGIGIGIGTSPLTIQSPPSDYKDKDTDMLPKIDKSGRFCSPRAARELALMILYAACLEGSDPLRLFEKRLNARREIGYEFDRAYLMEYDHMSFGGPPVTAETAEEADEILRNHQKESDIEAEVLSAPPKLVYSKLILRFTRKLLVSVAEKWDCNVLSIAKVAPQNWKKEPAGRILEFSILHLAMSEIAVLGTRHQIVINEAVDLAKRFCDGAAPRVINGCLRTYVGELKENGEAQNMKIEETV